MTAVAKERAVAAKEKTATPTEKPAATTKPQTSASISATVTNGLPCEAADLAPPLSSPDVGETSRVPIKRSHRKDEAALEALGIREPFDPSHRRDRQALTEAEDDALQRGFETHGGAWGAIRADPALAFASKRTPRDLRDRFRNRWPKKYLELGLKLRGTSGESGDGAGDGSGGSPARSASSANHIPPQPPSSSATTDPNAQDSTPPRRKTDIASLLSTTANFNPTPLALRHNDPFSEPQFTFGAEDNADGHTDRRDASAPTTPVFLDRSIMDWARGLHTWRELPDPSGGIASGGAARAPVGLPGLGFAVEHAPGFVDPLATWFPGGGGGLH